MTTIIAHVIQQFKHSITIKTLYRSCEYHQQKRCIQRIFVTSDHIKIWSKLSPGAHQAHFYQDISTHLVGENLQQ